MSSDLVLGVVVSAMTSLALCRLLIAAGLWDAPHLSRHQHRKPTPTSGGLGIAAGYALGVLAIVGWSWLSGRFSIAPHDARRLAVATAFAFIFLAIGFVDDTYPLGPRSKFGAFVLASIGAALAVGVAHVFPLGDGIDVDIGFWAGLAGSSLWIFTLVNCVNFMDGANGLAMGSVAVGMAGLAVIGFDTHVPAAGLMGLCAVGALVGFLVWNFPDGRLFAGDSGALFSGALAALASLMAIAHGGVSPFIPPMLFFPLLADALLTLAWRAQKKRNLMHGHADHLYQIAIRAGFSHGRIAVIYWLAAAFCAGVAVLAERMGGVWPPELFVGMAIAALLITVLVRRAAIVRNIEETQ